MSRRNGMTLVELLVVLAILALMTTVAVTSTDVLLSQGRYDATVRTLNGIRDAVCGPANARQSDGTRLFSGFVADMGRPPQCTSADSTVGLSELWALPAGAQTFSLQPTSDPDIVVACGWRGPYLQLSVGESNLRDGWGNPFNLIDSGGTTAALGEAIVGTQSNGGSGTPYNAPLSVVMQPPAITLAGHVYMKDTGGNVSNPPAGSQVTVKLYGPNPNTGGEREVQLTVTAGSDGVVSFSLPAGVAVYAPGFLRAYLGASANNAAGSSNISQFVCSQAGIALYIPSS